MLEVLHESSTHCQQRAGQIKVLRSHFSPLPVSHFFGDG